MKSIPTFIFGFIALFVSQAMSQEVSEAECMLGPPYTVVGIMIKYRYAFIPFIIILILKFIKNRRIPESANFIPFFMGLSYALFKWVWFYRTAVMGHPDRMANRCLEIIAFGSIFTILLIIVDVIRGLIKPIKRKEKQQSEPIN